MWKILFKGVASVFQSWIDLKKSKNEAEAARNMRLAQTEADWDLEAMRASKYSFKDEFIMAIWYSPLYMGWIAWEDAERVFVTPQEWIDFVEQLPYWCQFGAFGIMAASFGLRWYFRDQQFKLGDKKDV